MPAIAVDPYDITLIHTLEVWRRPDQLKDEYGQKKAAPKFEKVDGTSPCRVSHNTGNFNAGASGEVMGDRYADVVREPRTIFCQKGVDVTEADEILVRDEADEVILPRAQVIAVRPRYGFNGVHHVELIVEGFRASGESIQGAS